MRGLKLTGLNITGNVTAVAPLVGAWIETVNRNVSYEHDQSHPSWVRGLKLLCTIHRSLLSFVAPLVGAWIETVKRNLSRYGLPCRTPRGCVD